MKHIFLFLVLAGLIVLSAACEKELMYTGYAFAVIRRRTNR